VSFARRSANQDWNRRKRNLIKPGQRFLPGGIVCAVVLLLLSGCNTRDIYRDDRYNPPVTWGQHVVRSGETLSSIAWRYGRDYRELGNANGLSPPYPVQVGDVIRLDRRGNPSPRGKDVPSGSAGSRGVAATSSPEPINSPAPRVEKPPEKNRPLERQSQVVSSVEWRWPNVGPVIAGYKTSGKVNKGIDISGSPGDPVKAAADGNVVYAGSGLLGYGNLIIINHNEHYLSAYAHGRKILVQEGEDVRAGQLIAEMGSSGVSSTKLHFEIRKNGNPVDPVHYLPPR
jgi:lipoprotein NlpD